MPSIQTVIFTASSLGDDGAEPWLRRQVGLSYDQQVQARCLNHMYRSGGLPAYQFHLDLAAVVGQPAGLVQRQLDQQYTVDPAALATLYHLKRSGIALGLVLHYGATIEDR